MYGSAIFSKFTESTSNQKKLSTIGLGGGGGGSWIIGFGTGGRCKGCAAGVVITLSLFKVALVVVVESAIVCILFVFLTVLVMCV